MLSIVLKTKWGKKTYFAPLLRVRTQMHVGNAFLRLKTLIAYFFGLDAKCYKRINLWLRWSVSEGLSAFFQGCYMCVPYPPTHKPIHSFQTYIILLWQFCVSLFFFFQLKLHRWSRWTDLRDHEQQATFLAVKGKKKCSWHVTERGAHPESPLISFALPSYLSPGWTCEDVCVREWWCQRCEEVYEKKDFSCSL